MVCPIPQNQSLTSQCSSPSSVSVGSPHTIDEPSISWTGHVRMRESGDIHQLHVWDPENQTVQCHHYRSQSQHDPGVGLVHLCGAFGPSHQRTHNSSISLGLPSAIRLIKRYIHMEYFYDASIPVRIIVFKLARAGVFPYLDSLALLKAQKAA